MLKDPHEKQVEDEFGKIYADKFNFLHDRVLDNTLHCTSCPQLEHQ